MHKASADGAFASSAPLLPHEGRQSPMDVYEESDQDEGDVPTGVDEESLNDDDVDTDRITSDETN